MFNIIFNFEFNFSKMLLKELAKHLSKSRFNVEVEVVAGKLSYKGNRCAFAPGLSDNIRITAFIPSATKTQN